jgi:hypothetical protein
MRVPATFIACLSRARAFADARWPAPSSRFVASSCSGALLAISTQNLSRWSRCRPGGRPGEYISPGSVPIAPSGATAR